MPVGLKVCTSAFLALFVLSTSLQAYAEADRGTGFCQSLASMAAAAMESRQNGVSEKEALKSLDQLSPEQRELVEPAAKSVIGLAYARPRHKTRKMREQAAAEFGGMIFRTCKAS